MTGEELERQMDRLFLDLDHDLGDGVAPERISTVSHEAHFESLRSRRGEKFNDFIPLLVYRFAKEEGMLVSVCARDELHDAA